MKRLSVYSRRAFLNVSCLSAGLMLPGSSVLGMGKKSLLGIAMIQGLCADTKRESGMEKLMWEAQKRTSMKTDETPRRVRIDDALLYEHPLIVLSGTGEIKPLSEAQLLRLRHFLKLGGTLFVDDASAVGDDRFDQSFRTLMKRLWPEQPLEKMSRDHTFYRAFYMLGGSSGRVARDRFMYGVNFEDRSPILYSRNDVFGALCRDRAGQWLLPVRPGGARQREMALRFAINLLMYATSLNYKRDQVHVPAILKRRKWRVDH